MDREPVKIVTNISVKKTWMSVYAAPIQKTVGLGLTSSHTKRTECSKLTHNYCD
jgi:hypothetical protein